MSEKELRNILRQLVEKSNRYKKVAQGDNDIYIKGLHHGLEEAIDIIETINGDGESD